MSDFYDKNDHALRPVNIVLRDSLGSLAVQILAARSDFGTMSDSQKIRKLHKIISDLHDAYHQANGDFNE